MIDLGEPVRKVYTKEEEAQVRKTFLILVHLLLMFYLSLHNLLIPLVMNLLKGRPFYQDGHLWFLFMLPLGIWLKKGIPVARTYILFLIMGSLSRLGVYHLYYFAKSWTLVSVYLSEFSSLIFCFLIWPRVRKDKWGMLALMGLFLPFLLARVEVHSKTEIGPVVAVREVHVNYEGMGCKGSTLELAHPWPIQNASTRVSISDCGLEKNLLLIGEHVSVLQKNKFPVNLRLYQLIHREGRFSWKFVRMKRLEPQEEWNLDPWIKQEQVYLIKAPENRSLGMTVLLTEKAQLPGKFEMTFDTIKWSAHE